MKRYDMSQIILKQEVLFKKIYVEVTEDINYTDGLLKRNTWIAALIYVSKKGGKTIILVVCKESVHLKVANKNCPIKINLAN